MTSPTTVYIEQLLDYPIRKAFQGFYESFAQNHDISDAQKKAAECISKCKTGDLGYTVSYCPECGYKKMRARS